VGNTTNTKIKNVSKYILYAAICLKKSAIQIYMPINVHKLALERHTILSAMAASGEED
jgi:hypothetical protein